MNVEGIRQQFKEKWFDREFIEGRGGRTIEIIGASFLTDEVAIFGELNEGYVTKELQWYSSRSLNLNTFPGGAPNVWNLCSDPLGNINSNYGWCLDSEANGSQRQNVIEELRRNRNSRRAIAIYTRPSMHRDAIEGGKEDFICTNAVEYFIRNDRLHCVVQMRSSDAVLGYRNDRAWHAKVLAEIASVLEVVIGYIYWQVGSLHIYDRHFFYLERV